jgi:hypothetical protein
VEEQHPPHQFIKASRTRYRVVSAEVASNLDVILRQSEAALTLSHLLLACEDQATARKWI